MLEIGPTDYLIHKLGKTRREFALDAGFGENHLLRIAQGRMNDLPFGVVGAFGARMDRDEMEQLLFDGYGEHDLQNAYRAWRAEQQRQAVLPEFIPWVDGLSPAQRFAAAVGSMSKLAQVLRVNDYVVRRWVNGDTEELPAQMRDAMKACGWGHSYLLDLAQKQWLEEAR